MKYRIVILILLITTIAFSDTITVCDTCQISSIKQAISIANSGDEILVSGGVYKESSIFIDKKLRIIGIDLPVVDGGGSRNEEVFVIQADSVIIEGLKIQNVGPSFVKDLAAIRVKRKKHSKF